MKQLILILRLMMAFRVLAILFTGSLITLGPVPQSFASDEGEEASDTDDDKDDDDDDDKDDDDDDDKDDDDDDDKDDDDDDEAELIHEEEGAVVVGAPGVGLIKHGVMREFPFASSVKLGRFYKFEFHGVQAQCDADGVPGTYAYDGHMWDAPKSGN